MDNTDKLIISSHNICGFDNSKEFLYNQCDKNDISVLAVQEHWLRPPYRKNHGTHNSEIAVKEKQASKVVYCDLI